MPKITRTSAAVLACTVMSSPCRGPSGHGGDDDLEGVVQHVLVDVDREPLQLAGRAGSAHGLVPSGWGVLSGRLDVTSWWLWMRASAAEVADSPSISSAGAIGGALERP